MLTSAREKDRAREPDRDRETDRDMETQMESNRPRETWGKETQREGGGGRKSVSKSAHTKVS